MALSELRQAGLTFDAAWPVALAWAGDTDLFAGQEAAWRAGFERASSGIATLEDLRRAA
jgi:hypothetical protein